VKGKRFIDAYLGYLLGQANHAVFKGFEDEVRAAGLSSIEWRVLATLHDSEPLTVTQLAHEVLAQQPTVTKLVQRMSELGWVRLRACPDDQRRTMIEATPRGCKLVEPLLQRCQQHEVRLLKSLGASEVAALKKMLAKIAALDAA
jgi:DNA-binding MarR family transcriptional regulator